MLSEENKNYDHLVDEAEGAFLKKDYLEAFLIQSCVIEGVLRNYATRKLSSIIFSNATLSKKFGNFEIARLIDDLFIAGKIDAKLYEDLDGYRKKRNDVIHRLLEYDDKERLDQELREAYKLGKDMKGFIVDDMSKEVMPNLTAAELNAQIDALLGQISALQFELMKLFKDGGKGEADSMRIEIIKLLQRLNEIRAGKR